MFFLDEPAHHKAPLGAQRSQGLVSRVGFQHIDDGIKRFAAFHFFVNAL